MKQKIIFLFLITSGLAIQSYGQNIVMGTSSALGESSVAFGDSSLAQGYLAILWKE